MDPSIRRKCGKTTTSSSALLKSKQYINSVVKNCGDFRKPFVVYVSCGNACFPRIFM